MPARDQIVAFADELLGADGFADYAPVGLQVTGAAEVTRIACGVSASLELFRRARDLGAELLLVHHGMFWDRDARTVDAPMRARLEELFGGDISLVAYHLCLDAHATVGNNALLADALGVGPEREQFATVGLGGPLTTPCSAAELAARVDEILGRAPLVFAYGPERIERIAVCTGSAASAIASAACAGYDCLLTGEPAEPTMMAARELGITFIAAGHYATETFGVKALAALLAEEFDVPWEFIEIANPV
ncbi:MAG: Nif3-like dinuclear metal center hexameric protein [Gaiellaceae bacterium]